MDPILQQQHHHPALDHILDMLNSSPLGCPTLLPSTISPSSTLPPATFKAHNNQPLSHTAKPFQGTRPTTHTRPQQTSTMLPDVAVSTSSTTTLNTKKLQLNDWHARALPFRPKPAPAVDYSSLSAQAQDHAAVLRRWQQFVAESSSDDNDDAHASWILNNGQAHRQVLKSPHARKRAPSKMDLAFITHPSPVRPSAKRASQCRTLHSEFSDTSSPALPPLLEVDDGFGLEDGEEGMQELREGMLYAWRESENEEDRELWRWALGEEEWARWETLRVEEAGKEGGGYFEVFGGV
ncbi:hypothetical protein MMC17_003684 [Xylographa soralifera]|nr:hypothetical protein [Xylographa soralifera]